MEQIIRCKYCHQLIAQNWAPFSYLVNCMCKTCQVEYQFVSLITGGSEGAILINETLSGIFVKNKSYQVIYHHQLSPDGQLKGWRCARHAHPVEYIALPDATYYAWYFTCWHRDKELSVESYKLPQGEQWELKKGSALIIHLDFLPEHITPDNIDQKIRTLLVFS